MTGVVYRCENCGRETERQILELTHAIRGCGMMLDRNSDCCESPSYIDQKGVVKTGERKRLSSLRKMLRTEF